MCLTHQLRIAMNFSFDLGDLSAFRAVAQMSSFRKAAESIHISQPALSRRIDKLEEALGVRLLDRNTRSVSVTSVGREFLRTVDELLDNLDGSILAIRGTTATYTSSVTVACVPSTVYYFLSEALRRFGERYPKIRVKIFDASANDALAAVVGGVADIGLNFVGSQEPEIHFAPLRIERFVLACRKDHPLAKRKSVSWSELTNQTYISVSQRSGNRVLIDQALGELPFRPTPVYETQHVTTALGLVEAGLGVAVVPSLAMPNREHLLLASVPLEAPVVSRTVGLIRHRGRSLSPAASQLYDFFLEMRNERRAPRRSAQ
jgi:DNA-binding transcriptional LysR family regulator